ncbi:MAG: cytochrome c oxidase subunit II, partial [Nitrospiraceae bacterium]|nr:cytochrome c oxidase subunit II [Nitrospiraceae bacterium]
MTPFHWVSNTAGLIGGPLLIITAACVLLFLGVIGVMLGFLIRYNAKRNPTATPTRENTALEIIWTVIPLALVLWMFYVGWMNFGRLRNPPKGAMAVNVLGRQWSWSFTYANGRQSDKLRVPLGKAVKLIMTSSDVIHSFSVPAFKL